MSDDDNERDSGGVRTRTPSTWRRVGPGTPRSPAPVQWLRRVLPAVQRRPRRPASSSCPASRSTPASAATSTTASAAPIGPQRSWRAVPAQRVPQRAAEGGQLQGAVGASIQRRRPRHVHRRCVQRVQLGQHPALHRHRRHDGDQLLRRHGARRLRLRPADQPDFLAVTDAERKRTSRRTTRARRDRCSSACGSSSRRGASGSGLRTRRQSRPALFTACRPFFLRWGHDEPSANSHGVIETPGTPVASGFSRKKSARRVHAQKSRCGSSGCGETNRRKTLTRTQAPRWRRPPGACLRSRCRPSRRRRPWRRR